MHYTKTVFKVVLKRDGRLQEQANQQLDFSSRGEAEAHARYLLNAKETRLVYVGDGPNAQRQLDHSRVYMDDALFIVADGEKFETLAADHANAIGVVEIRTKKTYAEPERQQTPKYAPQMVSGDNAIFQV